MKDETWGAHGTYRRGDKVYELLNQENWRG
jgi:hypothetical protein